MSQSATDGTGGAAIWLRSPIVWLSLAVAGLGVYLYAPLFFPSSPTTLALQSEEFFFEANEAAGAPVLVLSAWLFFRRGHYRDLLRGPGAFRPGVALLLLASLLFGWGHFTGAPDLQLASVIPLLFGLAFCLGGGAAARAFWVPIVFLAFALPLPPVLLSATIYPIQLVTAQYAGAILNAIGVASFVQGDQILRPENTFIVIETCSGVRTIITLSMLTVLMIDLFERRGLHAMLLLLMAPIVAFLTNGFRVVTLVLNPHSSIHSIHNLQGIAMLLVGLTGIYLLDILLERLFGSRDPLVEEGDYGTEAEHAGADDRGLRIAPVLIALLVMVGMGRGVTPYLPPSGLAESPDALLTRVFDDGPSQLLPPDYQFRGSIRYLGHANRRIRVDGQPVEVFLGVANEQLRQFTVLTKRIAWPESGYAPIQEDWVVLEGGAGGEAEAPRARRMILRRGARTVLSYSFYLRDSSLPVELLRHGLAIDRSPLARDERILALRISTPLGPGGSRREEAEARLRSVWARLAPELRDYAPTRLPTLPSGKRASPSRPR